MLFQFSLHVPEIVYFSSDGPKEVSSFTFYSAISMVDAGSNGFIFKIKLLNNVLNSDSVGSALCVLSRCSRV